MAGLTATIDTATPVLRRAMALASPEQQRGLLMAWGIKARDAARTGARKHPGRMWRDMARSVTVRNAGPAGVIVRTDHVAAAQKQFGGRIQAKDAGALTIPIADEAKGKRASEFETGGRKLFVLPSTKPETIGVLGYNVQRKGPDQFIPLFVLRRSVTQKAEPWWPENDALLADGVRLAQNFITRKLKG